MPKIITERIIDRGFYTNTKPGLTESEILDLIDQAIDDYDQGNGGGGGGTAADPSMTVTPSTNIVVSAYVGDTITGSQEYTLTNTGDASLNWTITKSRSWVDLTSSSGTLAAAASTAVTVSINTTAAAALGVSENLDLIIFNAENA